MFPLWTFLKLFFSFLGEHQCNLFFGTKLSAEICFQNNEPIYQDVFLTNLKWFGTLKTNIWKPYLKLQEKCASILGLDNGLLQRVQLIFCTNACALGNSQILLLVHAKKYNTTAAQKHEVSLTKNDMYSSFGYTGCTIRKL